MSTEIVFKSLSFMRYGIILIAKLNNLFKLRFKEKRHKHNCKNKKMQIHSQCSITYLFSWDKFN